MVIKIENIGNRSISSTNRTEFETSWFFLFPFTISFLRLEERSWLNITDSQSLEDRLQFRNYY